MTVITKSKNKKRLTKNPINSQALQPKRKPIYTFSDPIVTQAFKIYLF
jgi:hypothetical protein